MRATIKLLVLTLLFAGFLAMSGQPASARANDDYDTCVNNAYQDYDNCRYDCYTYYVVWAGCENHCLGNYDAAVNYCEYQYPH